MFIKRMLQVTLVVAVLAASLAVPRSASADGPCGSLYIVQSGDWLVKIAHRCGVSLDALYAANPGVIYQRYIYPGQPLNIPFATPGGPVPGYPPPGPVVTPVSCPTPYCLPYTSVYNGTSPYFRYPSMSVSPHIGGNYFQANVTLGTPFTFEANIRNNGNIPLNVIASLATPADFDLNDAHNNCPGTLYVGAMCTFTWVFNPHARGVVSVRVYAKGFYSDMFGGSQRVTNSSGFFINVY